MKRTTLHEFAGRFGFALLVLSGEVMVARVPWAWAEKSTYVDVRLVPGASVPAATDSSRQSTKSAAPGAGDPAAATESPSTSTSQTVVLGGESSQQQTMTRERSRAPNAYETPAQCVVVDPAATSDSSSRLSGWRRFRPEDNLIELGIWTGVFLPARNHDLYERHAPFQRYRRIAPDFGVRAAYFPFSFLGAELEGAVIPTRVENGGGAELWALRAHLVGQVPSFRIVPFALLGGGALGANSRDLGSDVDTALHVGIGVKGAVDDTFSLRLDCRDTLANSSDPGSIAAHHWELLLGVTMTFNRTKPRPLPAAPPDTDGDKVPDVVDKCPADPAPESKDGCPPDSDGDGMVDTSDDCPTKVGPLPHGCPDDDADGIGNPSDQCPDKPETMNGCKDDDGCPDKLDQDCPTPAPKE